MKKGAKEPDFFEKARQFEIHLVMAAIALIFINLLI
jgi:hypothetical protein